MENENINTDVINRNEVAEFTLPLHYGLVILQGLNWLYVKSNLYFVILKADLAYC